MKADFRLLIFMVHQRLPSHGPISHPLSSKSFPGQGGREPEGLGEVHDRVLDFFPGPHSLEHSDHAPH